MRTLVLRTGVASVFHTALVFSLFLLFAGHHAPGGGVVGGLVAGAALVLRYLEGGSTGVGSTMRVEAPALLGAGLVLAGLTGVASLVAGKSFLESAKATFHVPVMGEVHASSSLPFDIGVYLVVVGLVLMVLRTLGAEGEDGDEDALVGAEDASREGRRL